MKTGYCVQQKDKKLVSGHAHNRPYAYSRFSHDVTTAMLVLNKEKAAMLVPRPNPPGI